MSAAGLGATAGLPGAALAAPAAGTRVVRFGQSASLSGGQAGYGADVRNGIATASPRPLPPPMPCRPAMACTSSSRPWMTAACAPAA